jgi:hypothetical protein
MQQISKINFTTANASKIDFTANNKFYTLIAVYRSPYLTPNKFIEELEVYLEGLETDRTIIITGDINIDLIKQTQINNEYLNILFTNGFNSCINIPTRETDTTKTCIDHIFMRHSGVGRTAWQ